MASLWSRLFGASREESPTHDMIVHDVPEFVPKRLYDAGPIQGPEVKASSMSLLPRGAYGPAYQFFSADGGRTFIEDAQLNGTVYAFVAYWYCATRWRAQKLAEAPLMVIKEDQKDGGEEWIADHELADVLENPSIDYDMGEMIERTSHYLDNSAECLWVMDRDRGARIARITPFRSGEFTSEPSDERLYALFRVNTADGQRTYTADEVCYFRDSSQDLWNTIGKSRLDVAMSWLQLGETARTTIRDLLGNAIWPSAVVIPDKDWNPDPKTLAEYKLDLEQYARKGRRGKPFVQLGGGTFESLSARIRDLVPTDVLNRVESVVAAVSGVPAIVLQFQIGMENSPWSQMAQARRMAYDDTIVPTWRRLERVVTRQMLRQVDDDPTHFIRFDRSQIDSLQRDQLETVQIANGMGKQATLNERRTIMGLEPATKKQDPDGTADDIPELTEPSMAELMAGAAANAPPVADKKPVDDPAKDPLKKPAKNDKIAMKRWLIQRKAKTFSLIDMFRGEASTMWELSFHHELVKDRDVIVDIVRSLLTEATHKNIGSKARGKDSVMRTVSDYMQHEGQRSWMKTTQPLFMKGAERSVAVVAADTQVSYNVLHPFALQFAKKNAGSMLSSVSKTTERLVRDIVSGGLEENRSTTEIAQLIRDATGFSKARAKLIAQTESTTIFSGAPVEAMSAFAKSTDRVFLKTWFGVMDEKERDEHVEMEGETVGVDEPFSNGLQYPSEPNCRCHSLIHEELEA